MRDVVRDQALSNFERVREIVAMAERLQIGNLVPKLPQGRLAIIWTQMVGGPIFWISGVEIVFKRLCVFAVMVGLAYGYISVFSNATDQSFFLPAFLLGICLTYFAMPSRVSMKGVGADRVRELSQTIADMRLSSERLKSLKEGVALFRSQAFERLTRFNYVAGLVWAALFWYFASHVLAPNLSAEVVKDGLSNSLMGAILFLMTLLAASAYAAAVRATYQTLDFAILEAGSESHV